MMTGMKTNYFDFIYIDVLGLGPKESLFEKLSKVNKKSVIVNDKTMNHIYS